MDGVVGLLERMVDRIIALEGALLWMGVFGWVALALVVAVLAPARGQSAVGFFFLALFLSSILAMLVLLFVPDGRARRQALLEARLAQLEADLGRPHAGADPGAPMLPSSGGKGGLSDPALAWIVVIALILIAVVGGVAQLGSSANATFTTIDGQTFTATPPAGPGR